MNDARKTCEAVTSCTRYSASDLEAAYLGALAEHARTNTGAFLETAIRTLDAITEEQLERMVNNATASGVGLRALVDMLVTMLRESA